LTIRPAPAAIAAVFLLSLCGPGPAIALKPDPHYPSTPGDFGIVFDEVAFATADSLTLRGWFIPAQDTAGIALDLLGRHLSVPPELRRERRPYAPSPGSRGPVIVMCDGDAGNMAYALFFAHHWFTQGFHVFMFDWRGFGESDPWPMAADLLCIPEFLTDYDAAIDCVKARPEVDRRRIGLFGYSTGAYLSFAMLVRRSDIHAFVGRGIMTNFADLVEVLRVVDPERGFRAPRGYPPDLEPVRAAPRVQAPVFLIVGAEDQRTPPWMTRRVAALVPGSIEVWEVPGAAHVGTGGPELTNYPRFFERVLAFYRTHLEVPSP
jgi:hypothetical protein